MKKTKIVATIGPASESEEILRELFLSGLNVCRLNFSHGSYEEHGAKIGRIKKLREQMRLPIAIMLDTKGPEVRIEKFEKGAVAVREGELFTLTSREVKGDEKIVSVSYKSLPNDVKVGDKILIDDGLVGMKVLEIKDGTDIVCKILNGGELKDRKSVNVPYVEVSLPAISEKDSRDLLFGIENGVDMIAQSFVRSAQDVLDARKILDENGGEHIEIIAKIENQSGVDNIEEILSVADGLMVARGDLGVEIDVEDIPLVQKRLIAKANRLGKTVITATQMLDSMIRNPRPTRAEVTDVANAILDGTSAIMLSGETASGNYPIEALKTMANIAERTEKALPDEPIISEKNSITDAIGRATVSTAQSLNAAAIITSTSSGYTSKAISKFHPKTSIIAVTTDDRVYRKLALVWGVVPLLTSKMESTDEVIDASLSVSLAAGLVKEGDVVVITAGIPVGISGTTNMMKVHTLGRVLASGMPIGKGTVYGRAVLADDISKLKNNFREGDILVVRGIESDLVPFVQKSSGIISEEAGITSSSAIIGLSLKIPTIVGVENAIGVIPDISNITMTMEGGRIYSGDARIV